MIILGEFQELQIIERTSNGMYLGTKAEKVLLPNNQVPEDAEIGNLLSVFIYKDSEDRLIATLQTPLLMKEEPAILTVAEVTPIGAFLNWGLAKDLLLPFKEQTRKVEVEENVLVSLYIDKSERLCATMNVYKSLSSDSPYTKGSHVCGTVYETSSNFGVFVAVDNKYSAIIPKIEVFREYRIGESVEARVSMVREDGKLNLSTREQIPVQMGEDGDLIFQRLSENHGFLPYHDKSNPDVIKREFGLSKNAYKRAIGRLMKEKKISIQEDGIHLI